MTTTVTGRFAAATCVRCGRPHHGGYEISMRGEVVCWRHEKVDRCVLCGRGGSAHDEPGWRPFADTGSRCPTCVAEAVETQVDARRYLPTVRTQMAALGIRLAARVRVTLVGPDRMAVGGSGTGGIMAFGLTHRRIWSDGRFETVGVEVVRGLTSTQFGATVAHELGHCWLAERGAAGLDRTVEEGICEMFANAWLKKQRTYFADSLREAMRRNDDPVYGGGYRLVRAAAARLGFRAVLEHVCRHGSLP